MQLMETQISLIFFIKSDLVVFLYHYCCGKELFL